MVRGSPQEDELPANLRALYEELWAPIGQALPSPTKRIIISPDGQLNFISFATLLNKDNQFLAKHTMCNMLRAAAIFCVSLSHQQQTSCAVCQSGFWFRSTAILAKADRRSADAGPVRGSKKGISRDWSFESLKGTQKESDELTRNLLAGVGRLSDFTGKAATKEALLKIHSPYILHLATHGFFAKEDPTATQSNQSVVERSAERFQFKVF